MPTTPARPDPARRAPQGVTTARRSRDADRRRRVKVYVISMVIRTLSFPLAVWAFLSDQVVVGFVLMLAAVLIPSVAVGLANAVDHRGESTLGRPVSPVQGLGAGAGHHDVDEEERTHPRDGHVVEGVVVESRVVPPTKAS